MALRQANLGDELQRLNGGAQNMIPADRLQQLAQLIDGVEQVAPGFRTALTSITGKMDYRDSLVEDAEIVHELTLATGQEVSIVLQNNRNEGSSRIRIEEHSDDSPNYICFIVREDAVGIMAPVDTDDKRELRAQTSLIGRPWEELDYRKFSAQIALADQDFEDEQDYLLELNRVVEEELPMVFTRIKDKLIDFLDRLCDGLV